jgi:hypothetical protein
LLTKCAHTQCRGGLAQWWFFCSFITNYDGAHDLSILKSPVKKKWPNWNANEKRQFIIIPIDNTYCISCFATHCMLNLLWKSLFVIWFVAMDDGYETCAWMDVAKLSNMIITSNIEWQGIVWIIRARKTGYGADA